MEEKNISVPNEIANDMFKAAAQNFYNNGYITGCIDGNKIGKRTGEGAGFVKGVIFTTAVAVSALATYLIGKAVIDEVDDMFGCNEPKKKPEEGNWKEVKEEDADGSESVQGEQ